MSDANPSCGHAFDEMENYVEQLYLDANPDLAQGQDELPADEVAPMYQALTQIQDRYVDPELIGKGGMKEIYRVYDLHAARQVAMAKPAESLTSADFDAFLREAHLTARLEHPCIINLFDMGINDNRRPFFTMELKKGRSLRDILRALKKGQLAGEFSLRERLNIILRICEGLAYAHSRRVLHLDIKPENIQVGIFGEVQVCDWGMGVVVPRKGKPPNKSEVLLDPDLYGSLLLDSWGTRGYMAPERRNPREPRTERMDIYALGCLLQEVVTLQSPERSQSVAQLRDVALAAIITKARHEDPARRYHSVEELHRDLTRYLGGYSTSVEGTDFVREVALFFRRNRLPCLITLVMLGVIVAGTGLFVHQLRKSRDEARLARGRAETALENYLTEKAASERRLGRVGVLVVNSVSMITGPSFMDVDVLPAAIKQSMQQLEHVIAENPPPDSAVWMQKFWIHFMVQDFETALEAIRDDRNVELVKNLVPLARKYASHLNPRVRLPAKQFVALLRELYACKDRSRRPLMEKMLFYDTVHSRTSQDRATIVQCVLEAINPDCRDLVLQWDPENASLRINGKGIQHLRIDGRKRDMSMLCLLMVLRPLTLDLGGVDIRDLSELRGLQLHELDLRGGIAADLSPLRNMISLRRVVVAPGQFTEEQLSRLPNFVEVAVHGQ